MNLSHFIFDFDGVVADTESVFATFDQKLINEALESVGSNVELSVEEIRAVAGQGGEDKLRAIANEHDIDISHIEEHFSEKRTALRKTLFADYKVETGKNLQAFLYQLTTPYALATNKTHRKLEHDMALMGLNDIFDTIVTADAPLRKKPEPDVIIKAAELINAPAGTYAYIGDTVNDMRAATAAGAIPIGFVIEGKTNAPDRVLDLEQNGAKLVIDDFSDLLAHIQAAS